MARAKSINEGCPSISEGSLEGSFGPWGNMNSSLSDAIVGKLGLDIKKYKCQYRAAPCGYSSRIVEV